MHSRVVYRAQEATQGGALMKRERLFKLMRVNYGLSQLEVADVLGYASRQVVSRKERSAVPITNRDLMALAFHTEANLTKTTKGEWTLL
jgi:transcriptional regulator with XRE-family HTH domain